MGRTGGTLLNADEISLTLPADEEFHGVAYLVLGGLAARLDLTYDHLEDIELALDTLLEVSTDGRDVTVRIQVDDDNLTTVVGPFTSVKEDIEDAGDDSLSLGRILATVCDGVDVSERDGFQWVELTKRVETERAAGR
jgi:anti-sigma regulatory factor (Ser/Thr protein kinase)